MTMHYGKTTLIKIVGGELTARSGGVRTKGGINPQDVTTMQKSFKDIARRTGHLEAAFAAWINVWHRSEAKVFKASGIPRWERLKPGYERWKRVHYPGQPILRREHDLVDSLTSRTRHSIIEIRPRTMRLGTKLFYSNILQVGSAKMEARPHVVVMQDAFNELSRITMDEIMRAPELKGGRRR